MLRKDNLSTQRSQLSPAKLALLEKRLRGEFSGKSKSEDISPRLEQGPVPLSFGQQRLWFLDQLGPGNPVYNRPTAIRLTGPVNVAALAASLNEILRRHEVLRTTFPVIDGEPAQVVTPPEPLALLPVDLGQLPETERETNVLDLITEEFRQPFDLARGPLFRTTLLQLGEKEYVLLLVIHHIVFDGWSMGVLLRELSVLYEALSNGNPPPLPELSIQYADWAHWQRQLLKGELLEAQLSYWRKQLDGAPPMLELPTDRPRPAVQTYRGARQSVVLPKSLSESLKVLSRQEDVTLYMTLLAAFQTLLHRYNGQDDVVVGSPIAGRTRIETEKLIGLFINTIVMRTDLSGEPTFRELLSRVREVAMGAYAHQDLPFEKLVAELGAQRDLDRGPLVQAMFQFRNVPKEAMEVQGLRMDEFEFDTRVARFDLSLDTVDNAEGLLCLFEYATDLFDDATITRMQGHFQTLLEGIIANPDSRLSDLPLLTQAERHQLLVAWNDTRADYPKDSCIHDLFEAQVERSPDQVALDFEGEQVTYRELNSRSNRLAHHLRQLGVGPETVVGVCLRRSTGMLVALFGILKAGGAYLPLDPEYPKERLSFILKDTELRVIVTQERLLESLPDHTANAICIDRDWEIICRRSDKNLYSGVTAENLAYVIYTSGSTGRPKGTLTEHRAICNQIRWIQSMWALGISDRFVQKTPYSFDVSLYEFFWPLTVGARLVIARPEGHRDPKYLRELVINEGITVIHFVPSWLQVFLQEPNIEACGTLRLVLCGGEALSPSLQREFFQRLPRVTLVNLYGPTEASVAVTGWTCDPQDQRDFVPIGYPTSNIQLYILDGALQPVPIGVRGELHIGGVGLARGYLNRPELMAERFIPDAFSDEPTARLYKTGDMARYLPDGSIDFLGRGDDQVKIRGFRIELGEIEWALLRHPSVSRTRVLTREDAPGGPSLVAYLVCNQEKLPSTRELRTFLKEQLPDYMIPAAFVSLDTLPLTPSGKVDRRALPSPVWAKPELEEGYVAPRTPVEEVLASIWSDVLGLERIGIHDNFFESGGHSLLAARVISRVLDTFRVEVPLRLLFEEPTVAAMAIALVLNQVKNIDQKDFESMLAELEE